MKFSLISILTLATLTLAAPSNLASRSTTAITAFSDTGSEIIQVDTTATPNNSVGKGADIADALIGIVDKTNKLIQQMVNKDIARRQRFTQEVVARLRGQYPSRNVVISNVGYSFSGNAVYRTTVWCKTKIGKDVSYDVIVWDKGTFQLKGDGGFQNWAYIVNSSCKRNGGWLSC